LGEADGEEEAEAEDVVEVEAPDEALVLEDALAEGVALESAEVEAVADVALPDSDELVKDLSCAMAWKTAAASDETSTRSW
jgi:hypothetical protein